MMLHKMHNWQRFTNFVTSVSVKSQKTENTTAEGRKWQIPGSSCPIIKHKQITIRCLLSNEIIQVLIQQFVTSMCTKLTFGRQIKIINNRFNPESKITSSNHVFPHEWGYSGLHVSVAHRMREILSRDWNFLQIPWPNMMYLFNSTEWCYIKCTTDNVLQILLQASRRLLLY
jgi:hypothetical protein